MCLKVTAFKSLIRPLKPQKTSRLGTQETVMEARTTGSLFNFPATVFLVQSYGLYVVEARGAILSVHTRPTCYVSKHTMYDEGE